MTASAAPKPEPPIAASLRLLSSVATLPMSGCQPAPASAEDA